MTMVGRMTKEEWEAKACKDKKESFEKWCKEPTNKMIVSMLPPSEHTWDVLRTAYEAGFNTGSAITMVELISIIMGREPRS